ncbi:MAG TPA: DUF5777 family beta-barrel protein, partial [Chitinophagaceae bacterium]|nr:DUF5777 family beta-barrel protein [Chitinophagaceae bacterium]
MKRLLSILFVCCIIDCAAQEEPVQIMTPKKTEPSPVKVFYSQKVINTKSAEVLRKGVLEFNVAHNFGDIAGDGGGIKRFFGLDNSTDVRIGFQLGISDKFNIVAARTKGLFVTQQWELGLKWQLLQQMEKGDGAPVSLTMYVNDVVSTQKRSNRLLGDTETSFEDFGDRHSQVIQLLLARKCGKISLQLNPLFLHTNHVVPYDQENIFALGGAMRIPLSKKIVILADYFHPFRSQRTKDGFEANNLKLYDPFGIGFEILTEGHVFHLNFTNATEILENRFIRKTVTNWGDGEFRWAFTLSRNFILF